MQLRHDKWYQGEIDVAGQRQGRGITLTPEWQLQMGHYVDGLPHGLIVEIDTLGERNIGVYQRGYK
jgi:hypothetical protein